MTSVSRRGFFLSAALVFISACGGGGTGPFDKGEVNVLVRDVSNNPVAGVQVSLLAAGTQSVLSTEITASNGRTQFLSAEGGVPLGEYVVRITLPSGFRLAANQVADVPLTIRGDGPTTILFRLQPA